MHGQDLAILKGLIAVAWADGRVSGEEAEVIDALLEAFHAAPSEALEVRAFAKTPRTLSDIPIHDLSGDVGGRSCNTRSCSRSWTVLSTTRNRSSSTSFVKC